MADVATTGPQTDDGAIRPFQIGFSEELSELRRRAVRRGGRGERRSVTTPSVCVWR